MSAFVMYISETVIESLAYGDCIRQNPVGNAGLNCVG